MEMNTRLQVEHPVTEAITGVDLVDWQLRVASGQALPLRQDQLQITGHAFEARLYAEDVPAGFLPATGTLAALHFPAQARIDSGVAAGSEISPWYDPMIAKITVHGPDRGAALTALSTALAQTQVAGTVTNLGFLQRLAAAPDFVTGTMDTGLIGRMPELAAPAVPGAQRLAYAALIAAGLDVDAPWQGFALWQGAPQRVLVGEESVLVTAAQGGWDVQVGEQIVQLRRAGPNWRADGALMPRALRHGAAVTGFGADPFTLDLPDPLARGGAGPGGDVVLSPMPGLVAAVAVTEGQSVAEGDRMVVLEAMKMEHVLRAPRSGIVAQVAVTAGDQVKAGVALVTLAPEDAA